MLELIAYFHVSLAIHGLLWLAIRQERLKMQALCKEAMVRVANVRGVW